MYPATQAAMFCDPYSNVAGLGGYPALTLSSCLGAVFFLGRGRIVKYMSARAICKNLGMPYWQPTATSTSNYYVRQGQVSSRSSLWVSTQLTGSQIQVTARPDYSDHGHTHLQKHEAVIEICEK